MRLVDSHCHIQADRFANDAGAVLRRALEAGVERILVPGWNRRSSEGGLELVARLADGAVPDATDARLDVAVGVHPHDASSVDGAGWAWFVEAARDPRVVAIGETGLDTDRMFSPLDAQIDNLRRNLALSIATGKPAILHCRSAAGRRDAQDLLAVELRRAGFDDSAALGALGPFGGRPPAVVHSYSGPPDYAETMLEMGLVLSFGGLVFRPGEEASADAARMAPRDRLLLETDSPYLSPPGGPKGRNEPAAVAITGGWLAGVRGEDPGELGDAVVATYDRLFR